MISKKLQKLYLIHLKLLFIILNSKISKFIFSLSYNNLYEDGKYLYYLKDSKIAKLNLKTNSEIFLKQKMTCNIKILIENGKYQDFAKFSNFSYLKGQEYQKYQIDCNPFKERIKIKVNGENIYNFKSNYSIFDIHGNLFVYGKYSTIYLIDLSHKFYQKIYFHDNLQNLSISRDGRKLYIIYYDNFDREHIVKHDLFPFLNLPPVYHDLFFNFK